MLQAPPSQTPCNIAMDLSPTTTIVDKEAAISGQAQQKA
jgi:hypothetical protein